MPKYFCEYCGIFLTHSSPWGRKQHSHGRKHVNNKIEYYSQFIYEFQQNKYKHMMELATLNSTPHIQHQMQPRIIPPPMGNMPMNIPNMQNMQNIQNMPPPMPMHGFPPGVNVNPMMGMSIQQNQNQQIPPKQNFPGINPNQTNQ